MRLFIRLFTIVLVCAAVAFSQNTDGSSRQKIAVYVTGSVNENEKKVLGTRILSELINSNRYRAVERSDDFVKELDRELSKQMSGDVDDNQITAIGRQYGVQVICVADWTQALGSYSVSARLIEIESAEIIALADESCYIVEMKDLQKISTEVARVLLGGKKDKKFKCADKPKNAVSGAAAPVAGPSNSGDAGATASAGSSAGSNAVAAGSNVNNNTNTSANANNINILLNSSASSSSGSGSSGSPKTVSPVGKNSIGVRAGYWNEITFDLQFATITKKDHRIDMIMGYCGGFKYTDKKHPDSTKYSAIEMMVAYGWALGANGSLVSGYVSPLAGVNIGVGNSKDLRDVSVGAQAGVDCFFWDDIGLGVDFRPTYLILKGKDVKYTIGVSAKYRL
jgi:hypothetical protein